MPFRYLRDPLFLACFIGYFVNRWLIRPHVHGGFFHNYFNDCICVPFWVPIMLWGMRRLGLRKHDDTPSWIEIAVPVALWSYVFKVYLPFVTWLPRAPAADPADIRAFAAGGLCALLFWNWWYGAQQEK